MITNSLFDSIVESSLNDWTKTPPKVMACHQGHQGKYSNLLKPLDRLLKPDKTYRNVPLTALQLPWIL